jgi:hypothetical protein
MIHNIGYCDILPTRFECKSFPQRYVLLMSSPSSPACHPLFVVAVVVVIAIIEAYLLVAGQTHA